MPIQIDYSTLKGTRYPRGAVLSLVCGVASGPLMLISAFLLSDHSHGNLLLIVNVGVLVLATIGCGVLRFRLPPDAPGSARIIATLGVLFPIIYGVLVATLFCMSVVAAGS